MQKRWDLWSFSRPIHAIANGKYGEIIASDGRLISVGTGTTLVDDGAQGGTMANGNQSDTNYSYTVNINYLYSIFYHIND